ncbi:MAG: CDP-glycerol glycerophosphotransferase family protein [Anaerolineae bacterium]|nr:CDP-glycerol glycerophosphotransferase family protein [Anaerolineae bacterium]
MNLFLTIPQGQCVRDFLTLGVVEYLQELLPDWEIVILSPAYNIPAFLDLIPENRVHVRRMEIPTVIRGARIRRMRMRQRNRRVIEWLVRLENRRFTPPDYLMATFQEFKPDLLVCTHPMTQFEYEPVVIARRLGIPTMGVVKSWDNVARGFNSRPDRISVWGPVNYQEALDLQGYTADEVAINGSPSFDPYYDDAWLLPRDEFIRSLGLDPGRPVITYATVGVYDQKYLGRDETYLVDDMLRMFTDTPELRGAQLIIRLHPLSRLENFWSYRVHPDIVFSFASYMPAIGWYPTRDDLVHQTNLLKHSDVIVTPGSSWAIEGAILDTPTVVPVYSDIQPDHAKAQFDAYHLTRHFKPLAENDWVPICRSYQQLQDEIVDQLTQRDKYAAGREAIVDNYVYYRDANSARRVANWVAQTAKTLEG